MSRPHQCTRTHPGEARLRDDHRIGVLVNNAGTPPAGGFVDQNPDEVARIVSLDAVAPVRLASAVAPRLAQVAVRFAYESNDDSGHWYRSYGNENWEFNNDG